MSLSETGPWPSDGGGHVGTVSAGYTPGVVLGTGLLLL